MLNNQTQLQVQSQMQELSVTNRMQLMTSHIQTLAIGSAKVDFELAESLNALKVLYVDLKKTERGWKKYCELYFSSYGLPYDRINDLIKYNIHYPFLVKTLGDKICGASLRKCMDIIEKKERVLKRSREESARELGETRAKQEEEFYNKMMMEEKNKPSKKRRRVKKVESSDESSDESGDDESSVSKNVDHINGPNLLGSVVDTNDNDTDNDANINSSNANYGHNPIVNNTNAVVNGPNGINSIIKRIEKINVNSEINEIRNKYKEINDVDELRKMIETLLLEIDMA